MSDLVLHFVEQAVKVGGAVVRKTYQMIQYLHTHLVNQDQQLALDKHHKSTQHSP